MLERMRQALQEVTPNDSTLRFSAAETAHDGAELVSAAVG